MSEVLGVAGWSRQGYHQAHQRKTFDQTEEQSLYLHLIEGTREVHPGMGLRQIYDLTHPVGIGRDKFIQLGMANGYRIQDQPNPTRTTYSTKSHRYANLLGDREFTDVNQVWVSDITYFQTHATTYYIALVMDVYSRYIVGWNVEIHMQASSMFAALEKAITLRGIDHYEQGLIHHSDRGTQYASNLYTDALEQHGIQISMCQEVHENAHIERANHTVKNQYLRPWIQVNIPTNLQHIKLMLDKAVNTYNHLRPHQSIGNIPPNQYEQNLKNIPTHQRNLMRIYTVDNTKTNVTNLTLF